MSLVRVTAASEGVLSASQIAADGCQENVLEGAGVMGPVKQTVNVKEGGKEQPGLRGIMI